MHQHERTVILWCYLRNSAFKQDKDYHLSADLTGQANHLGVTIEADIIKQKLAQKHGGYQALNMGDSSYGKVDECIYFDLASDRPIDLCRYEVANCFMGRAGLINSGGASGANDFEEAVVTAVINKRAGGTGLISSRKAFQRPLQDGIQLLNYDPGRLLESGSHRRLGIFSHGSASILFILSLEGLAPRWKQSKEFEIGSFAQEREP